jgi:uncharacterized protein (UPF0264 family)
VKLLVSVRNAEEARAALAGGAAIIDAKDPSRGALGPVGADELARIRTAVPLSHGFSAALGDVETERDVIRALDGLTEPLDFVKLGFRGVGHSGRIESLLGAAVGAAANRLPPPRVVAVAYADWERTASLAPQEFPELIRRAGASGLLVDTAEKGAGSLRDFLTPGQLVSLGQALRGRRLSYAVAGTLSGADVPLAFAAGAEILGVRGAVTRGGRNGPVDRNKVAVLAALVGEQRLQLIDPPSGQH